MISEAKDGASALRRLAEAPAPDVVLLDYLLPDSRDLDLLAAVKRLVPATRVILMSAYLSPETTKDALAKGAFTVVTKPIDMKDVSALVQAAAAHPVAPA